jgi:hypothetical protein
MHSLCSNYLFKYTGTFFLVILIVADGKLSASELFCIASRVDTKVDFSISRNTKFYAKLKFISRNFAKFREIS